MNRNAIPRILMTAVRPRNRLWIAFFIVGLVVLIMSILSIVTAGNQRENIPNLLVSVGGTILTVSGILFAGNQASRIALSETFSKLYDQESSAEQYHAKKRVYSFGRQVLGHNNRYISARKLMNSLSKNEQNEIHEARRRIRHFWLLAESFYESGLMTPSEVFSVAGSPEIMLSLEPLEVLAAEQAEFPMKKGPWTSLGLLSEWYKLHGDRKTKISKTLPIDEELYLKSLRKRRKSA